MIHRFSRISFWLSSLGTLCVVFSQDAAKAAASAPSSPMAALGSPMVLMMLVMFFALYFLMIRPEQKKQKERQAMLQAIKKGDRVLTASGILGTVGSVKENTMMVKIADNTVVEFTKSAITAVINKDGSEKQPEPAVVEGEKK